MLKIAFLTPSLHVGGAEQFIATLARSFQHARPVGVVLSSNFYEPRMVSEVDRTCPVIRPDGPALSHLRDTLHEVAQQCDVIISWGIADLPKVAQGLPCAVVEVSHGSGEWEEQTALVEQSWRGAHFLAAVSRTALTAFPEECRGTAKVIYSGASLDRCAPHFGRQWQRNQWGVDDGDRVALFLGRFAEVKGPERLIRAMPHLPDEWHAAFYGHGPDADKLVSLAKTTAPGRCHFRPQEDHVGDLLAGADCLVMPSDCEGMPMAMVEAWHAGLPVVTTRYGWVDEMENFAISNGRGAPFVVAASTDGQDIAKAAIAAVDDFDALGHDSPPADFGKAIATEFFTASMMAARWETFLAECVQQKRNSDLGLV